MKAAKAKQTAVSAAEVIAFVATCDGARARGFYEGKLELRLVSEDPFALVFDAHGTMLRVQKVQALKPAQYTVLGWRVPDIRAAVKDLAGARVAFERYQGMGQDELGIWVAPSGAKVAWFKDPDGNTLSLTEVPTSK